MPSTCLRRLAGEYGYAACNRYKKQNRAGGSEDVLASITAFASPRPESHSCLGIKVLIGAAIVSLPQESGLLAAQEPKRGRISPKCQDARQEVRDSLSDVTSSLRVSVRAQTATTSSDLSPHASQAL